MDYLLYRLEFSTALHIGRDGGGASLDDGQMGIHADTLLAALCCEAARNGSITELVDYFADGILTISDALPFAGPELFLPKPVLFTGNKKREGEAGLKKLLKALEYIPLSAFNEYLQGLRRGGSDLEKLRYTFERILKEIRQTGPCGVALEKLRYIFGQLTTVTRVAVKGDSPPLPYHVTAWKFASGCGLYVIVRYEREEALDIFTSLLNRLGLSGIGGKQSSGWGKFEARSCPAPKELKQLLDDRQAAYQMLLGTALPEDDELEQVLGNGWYTLVRRGGFVRSSTYATGQLKKRSLYMLGPGSCLAQRFRGGMYDLSAHGAHPVWRCGKSLFAGVNL